MISTNRPNDLLDPYLCSLIGEPNPNLVGGPLSHSTHKRKVGVRARKTRFTGAATHLQKP